MQKILRAFDDIANQNVLQKGDLLLREGEIETKLYLIEEGAVKLAYPSEGDEKITRLAYNGSLVN